MISVEEALNKILHFVNELESELMSLRTQRDSFLARFKSMLRDQLALLDVISGSIKDKDGGGKSIIKKDTSTPSHIDQDESVLEDETMDEVPPQPVV